MPIKDHSGKPHGSAPTGALDSALQDLVRKGVGRVVAAVAGELMLAALLVVGFIALWRNHEGSSPGTSEHGTSGPSSMDMPGMDHAAMSSGPDPATYTTITIALLTVLLAGGVLFARSARWLLTAPRTAALRARALPSLIFGIVAIVLALLPWTARVTLQSHLAFMTQMMVLLVTGPALLIAGLRPWLRPVRLSTRTGQVVLAVTGVAYVAVLYLWHLPELHNRVMTGELQTLEILSVLGCGLLFSCAALLPAPRSFNYVRLMTTLAVGGASGVLGLALLISPVALMHVPDALPWGMGSVTDQRLAGFVMMLGDALVLIPLVAVRNVGRVASSAGTSRPPLQDRPPSQ